MNLSIITPQTILFKGVCELVQMPGEAGSFAVLENHAPLIAVLDKGKIRVKEHSGQETFFEITNGFVQVKNNDVVILVED